MTENEAIKKIKYMPVKLFDEEADKAKRMAIEALEEIQQYRAIGTVEEFKALKEKSVAKKPIVKGVMGFAGEEEYHCPNCNQKLMY